MTNDKAIAKQEPLFPAVAKAAGAAAELADVLAPGETISQQDLPKMKLPSGTSTSWELPNGQPVKTLEAVILRRQPFRAYWKGDFEDEGGGAPPDCTSNDMLTGTGDNGQGDGSHECLRCPLSQFGSGKNGGKACRELTNLYLLHESSPLPIMLRLGVTSTPVAKSYALTTGGGYKSVTEIGLVTDKNKGGISYPVVTLTEKRRLSDEELAVVEQMRKVSG